MNPALVALIASIWTLAVALAAAWFTHRLARSHEYRDKLRLAYVDLFSATEFVQRAAIKLAVEANQMLPLAEEERLDRFAGSLFDARGEIYHALNNLKLLEAEISFLDRVSELEAQITQLVSCPSERLDESKAISSAIGKTIKKFISDLREHHPELRRRGRPFLWR